jgi:hypothetical protein
MCTGRPRTPIGTHGAVNTRREGGRVVAETRVRDLDGRLRQVRATGPTAAAARARLMERIRERPALPSAGVLRPTSLFADLPTCGWPTSNCATWQATPRRTTGRACAFMSGLRSSTTRSLR